eukprot:752885-Hanusia_phi.AAC.3
MEGRRGTEFLVAAARMRQVGEREDLGCRRGRGRIGLEGAMPWLRKKFSQAAAAAAAPGITDPPSDRAAIGWAVTVRPPAGPHAMIA